MTFFRLNFEILLACHSDSRNNDESCLSRSELNDQSQSRFKGHTIGGFPRGPHHLRRESQQTAGNIDDFSVAGASSTIIYIRSNRPLNRLLKVEIHQSTHKVHHWATILRFLPTIWFVQNRNEFSNVSGASICKWKLTATQNPDYSVYSVINLTIHTINIP